MTKRIISGIVFSILIYMLILASGIQPAEANFIPEVAVSPEYPSTIDSVNVAVGFSFLTMPPDVEEFGPLIQADNTFSVNVTIYVPAPDEVVLQITHDDRKTYSLGQLPEGTYEFKVYVYYVHYMEGFHYLAGEISFAVTGIKPDITVPDNYSTIQGAIDHADEGNTIFVRNGIYSEHVVVNKTVSLVGEDKFITIVDGSNNGTPITILASGVQVSSFTIQNSSKLDPWFNEGTDGLYLEASNCTVSDNIVSNNARGIRTYQSMNNTFHQNMITDNWEAGFLVAGYCGGNTLSSNNVSSNGLGIVLYRNGYSNVLRNNMMMNNSYNFMVDADHMGQSNPALLDVDSSNTVDGKPIYYWVGEHNRTIPEDAGYVAIINSEYILAENLTLVCNGQGVLLFNSRNCTIRGVNVSDNLNGIMLYASENCTINDNTIAGCNEFLLYISGFGTYLKGSCSNRFYHNNFVDNSHQVLIDKLPWESFANTWDNGCEGNYWSDYNGTDSGDDGISDTPYVIDGNNTDRYPLMNPYWLPGDINHDLKIDIYDVVRITGVYGSEQGDPNWNCHSDIAEPYGIINIYDVVTCTKDYRKEYNS